MGLIADRLKLIKPSPTLAVSKKANELKAQGLDVIILSAGEPDFDTPEHIKQGAIDAIKRGDTKYTNVDGTPQLKKAIIDKFKRENNLTYEMNQIIVGTGGKQVLYNAIFASVNPGDEVIVPAPYWVSYPDIVALAEGVTVPIACGAEYSFKLQPHQLEAAITPKTKWLVLNSPSNPTGASYTETELKALAEVLLKHPQIYVLSDDIYEHLVYDNEKFYTMAQVEPKLFDRILTLNGVSKSFSMTGWRIGYAGGPKELINAMSIIQSQSTSNPSSISQAAATVALSNSIDFMIGWRQSFAYRRDLVVNMLNTISGIECLKPTGAFYVFPKCNKLFGKKTPNGAVINNSNDLAAYLLDEVKVAVVPGSAFGLEGYFRISYATSENVLKDACTRIAEGIKKLS